MASTLAAQTTEYVAFGDSITQGDETGGYPTRLQGRLANAVVRNHGLGGEKTPAGVTRIDSVLAQGGDVLLLMEGTNDISRQISQETTLFNLNEMARKAEALGMEAIHATTIPRQPSAKIDRANLVNQELNQEIREIAGTRSRLLVDNFEIFSVQTNLFARLYIESPPGGVGHPNGAGYDLMAGVFEDVLEGRDSVSPVPGVISPNNGDRNISASAIIQVDVWDFGNGLSLPSTVLLVDGFLTAAQIVGDNRRGSFSYVPPSPLSGVVTVALRSSDLSSPANTFDREIANFIIAGTVLVQGDIDENGRVDGGDLIRLAVAFGSSASDRHFDRDADLNGDGVIDGLDLAILASNFGRSV